MNQTGGSVRIHPCPRAVYAIPDRADFGGGARPRSGVQDGAEGRVAADFLRRGAGRGVRAGGEEEAAGGPEFEAAGVLVVVGRVGGDADGPLQARAEEGVFAVSHAAGLPARRQEIRRPEDAVEVVQGHRGRGALRQAEFLLAGGVEFAIYYE